METMIGIKYVYNLTRRLIIKINFMKRVNKDYISVFINLYTVPFSLFCFYDFYYMSQ